MTDAPAPDEDRVVRLRQELRNAPVVGAPDPAAPDHDGPPVDPSDPGPSPDDYAGAYGGGRDGDRPFGEIFDDCPVTALGVEGDHSYYLDTLGQLRWTGNHTAQTILSIFGNRLGQLCSAFPSYNKDGDPVAGKFNPQQASMAMIAACADRGLFSPVSSIRGTGAWTDSDGGLIYHAGDKVLIGGEWRQPGFHDAKLYPAYRHVPKPATTDPARDPGEAVLELLTTWAWRRPAIDPQLMLGAICAQMIGGALDWRPVTWLTGDAATGKSTLQKLLGYLHGGDDGLLQAADATEAGIRSILGTSSLPVALDEFEPDADNPRKTRSVIELARRAASGAQIFRGSADQKGHQSNAYSCFLFSSILIPHMPAQDLSRLIVMNLDRIGDGTPPKLDPRTLRLLGSHLKRRLIEGWPLWSERLELWRAALAEAGHAGRGADNYGTILACADAALFPDILPTPEQLVAWSSKMVEAILDEGSDDSGSNAENMVLHLMGQQIDIYRRGEKYTVAEFVMAAAQMDDAPSALKADAQNYEDKTEKTREANRVLAKVGMRVRGFRDKAELFFAKKEIEGLKELFDGSEWARGVWYQAAERLPGATRANLTLGGIATRGAFVPLGTIPGFHTSPPPEGRPTIPPLPDATHPGPDDFC